MGLILAGGRARRMGGVDKAFLSLAGQSLLVHSAVRIGPQVLDLCLSANGDASRFSAFGWKVLPDPFSEPMGPLAGILAGLDEAAARYGEAAFLLSSPVDVPFVPLDLLDRLWHASERAEATIAIATSHKQRHFLCGLWPVTIRAALRFALIDLHIRTVEHYLDRYRVAECDFSIEGRIDPLFNINTSEDLRQAERLAAGRSTPQPVLCNQNTQKNK